MSDPMITPEERAAALDHARYLASHDVPIFLCNRILDADGNWLVEEGAAGFKPPPGWQKTLPNPAVVDKWRPGMAICAVTGHQVDAIDVDPRHDGDKTAAGWVASNLYPNSYGKQSTPSGGWHDLISPLNVGSRDNAAPGTDVKSGQSNGSGLGFIFLAPTIKAVKGDDGKVVYDESGQPVLGAYRWLEEPNFDDLDQIDDSGSWLAERIKLLRRKGGPESGGSAGTGAGPRGGRRGSGPRQPRMGTPADGTAYDDLRPSEQRRIVRYLDAAIKGMQDELSAAVDLPEGHTDDWDRGWQKLLADVAYRLGALVRAPWTPWSIDGGWEIFQKLVPPEIAKDVPPDREWHQQSGRAEPAPFPPDRGDLGDGKAERKSVAALLVDLAQERYTFGVTPDGDPFAVERGSHVVRTLRGGRPSLRAELAASFNKKYSKVASQAALTDALTTIEGMAQTAEPTRLALRLIEHDGAVWIDMGDTEGRVIKIAGGRWEVLDQAPVLFRRTELTGAFPTPVRGGSIEALWQVLNVKSEDRPLVLAWLIAALLDPGVPHAVLGLFGEQGTAKSTTSKYLVKLLDPSPVENRKAPRDEDGWVVAASGSWVVALDNLSVISGWLSDALCRAATGDADVKRELYTNNGMVVFRFLRAVIINGIALDGLRGDLVDRMVSVDLDVIPPEDRLTEAALAQQWNNVYPALVGVLLDLAAKVHQVLPTTSLVESPRMADFGMVLAALDKINGTNGLARFVDRSSSMSSESLNDNPFIVAIMNKIVTTFEGTAKELLDLVNSVALTDVPSTTPRSWPKTPKAVSGLLKRNAPALRKAGWTINDLGSSNHDKVKRWLIVPPTSKGGGETPADAGHAETDNPPAN